MGVLLTCAFDCVLVCLVVTDSTSCHAHLQGARAPATHASAISTSPARFASGMRFTPAGPGITLSPSSAVRDVDDAFFFVLFGCWSWSWGRVPSRRWVWRFADVSRCPQYDDAPHGTFSNYYLKALHEESGYRLPRPTSASAGLALPHGPSPPLPPTPQSEAGLGGLAGLPAQAGAAGGAGTGTGAGSALVGGNHGTLLGGAHGGAHTAHGMVPLAAPTADPCGPFSTTCSGTPSCWS